MTAKTRTVAGLKLTVRGAGDYEWTAPNGDRYEIFKDPSEGDAPDWFADLYMAEGNHPAGNIRTSYFRDYTLTEVCEHIAAEHAPTAAEVAEEAAATRTRIAEAVLVAEAEHRAERAEHAESLQQTADLIAAAGVTPTPVRQTVEAAGRPATALYYGRGITPTPRPVLVTFNADGNRVYDARTGAPIAHYASPVPMWLAPVPAAAAAPAPVVIVPCGGVKAPGRLPAGEKYTGSYHLQTRKAAAAIAKRTGARVLILSALYGLLELADLVDDYDLRMGQPGSVTAGRVAEQAAALGITDSLVTVIAGKKYADVVTAVWPHAVRVLDGTNGIGAQMARMAAIVRGTWAPAALYPTSAGTAAVPALFGADLVAPPALELARAADLRRGDVLAPGTFGVTGADPVLVTATPIPAGDDVAMMVRPLTHSRSKYIAVPADYGVDVTGREELPASIATAPNEYPMPPVDQAERVALAAMVARDAVDYVPAAELRAGDLVAPGGFGPWNKQDTITITAGPVYCDTVAGVARYDIGTRVNLPAGPGPETHGALSGASFVPVVARVPLAPAELVDVDQDDVDQDHAPRAPRTPARAPRAAGRPHVCPAVRAGRGVPLERYGSRRPPVGTAG